MSENHSTQELESTSTLLNNTTDSLSISASALPSAHLCPISQDDKQTSSLPRRDLQHRIKEMGWWWEIGAIAVSFICMVLIVSILFTMDGKPLRTWKLPIQPNSLVAVFSTIAKSTLIVPVAECTGQLKCDYFHDRPRKVHHMKTFDGASRGPWGALVLLYRTRGSSALAAFASVVTILTLAFDPFTQQVIEVHSQDAVLLNTSGVVSSAAHITRLPAELPQGRFYDTTPSNGHIANEHPRYLARVHNECAGRCTGTINVHAK